jgi:hypothetical protein
LSRVAPFDSHWSCPVLSLTGPLPRGRMLFPRRPPDQSGLEVRTLYRLTRPCFSGRKTGAGTCLHIALPPHGLAGTPRSGSAQSFHAAAASHQHEVDQRHLSRFWLVFFRSEIPNFGTRMPAPAASTGWRSGHFWNPSGSDQRDPNTLAPNRIKTRTTPSRPSRISTSF